MAETTQTQTTEGTPQGYGYCSWHQRFADDVRLIQLTEAGSGGIPHYACPQCRHIFKLTTADRA
ncbi:hypothetical protein ACIQ8D_07535 [Streptomyces sp. NPDC096094]|uniref:hypothetical protein n=1 Tax=Streptomyces sp. NPDC096094 TaxID=3366073 RepID=UPI003810BCFA